MRSIRSRAIGPPAATATAVDELILFLPRIGIVVLELAGLSRVGLEMLWVETIYSGSKLESIPRKRHRLPRATHTLGEAEAPGPRGFVYISGIRCPPSTTASSSARSAGRRT